LTEVRSRLFENQGTHFILHFSFFILHYTSLSFIKIYLRLRRFYCNMKSIIFLLIVFFLLAACGNKKNTPDVSHIKIALQTQRFDKAFFGIDTNDISGSWKKIATEFPGFSTIYTEEIMGAGKLSDTNAVLAPATRAFLRDLKPLYDAVKGQFENTNSLEATLKKGFQLMTHYFPSFKTPRIIYYMGKIGNPGVALTGDAVAIGMQMYGGKDLAAYTGAEAQELFPLYISRRFEKQYIPVNIFQAIIEDQWPDKSQGRPLVEQMIEKGKRLYLLSQLLPDADDTLKTGYTGFQLKGCYKNEGLMWNFFLQNNLLYNTEPATTRIFLEDAPRTQEFGDDAPGNTGSFIGWQIVKKYMEDHKGVSPAELMKTTAATIFQESRYKPR
jgi:hypothetical protein